MKKLMAMVAGLVGLASVANAYPIQYAMVAFGRVSTSNPNPTGTYSTYTGRLLETSTVDIRGGLKFPSQYWTYLELVNSSYSFGVSSKGKIMGQMFFDIQEVVAATGTINGRLRVVVNLNEFSRNEATATVTFNGSWMVMTGIYDCAGWTGGGSANVTAKYDWHSGGKNPDWLEFEMLSSWNTYVPGFILTGTLQIPEPTAE